MTAGVPDELDPDVERVREANALARERAIIASARRRAGTAGAVAAAIGVAIQRVLEPQKRHEAAEIQVLPSEPEDLDADGIELTVDDIGGLHDVGVPPMPRRPVVEGRRRSRRRTTG